MKKVNYAISTAVIVFVFTIASCSKLDWKIFKDKGSKCPIVVADCDVSRVYTIGEDGNVDIQMNKTYYSNGRVKKIAFYTYSAVSAEIYWHTLLLDYNAGDCTIDIIDSASGEAVLKAVFNHSGKLVRLKRLQGETSDFSDRSFEYEDGRLVRINSRWQTFDFFETFTYDTNGNIVRRAGGDAGGVTEEAIYTYGAPAIGKRQFYIPQFNYMIVADPSMALIEYLGWIKDFSPKNILTGITYLSPLPTEDTYTSHSFDAGGRLSSYSDGDYAGGTKYIDWRCGK